MLDFLTVSVHEQQEWEKKRPATQQGPCIKIVQEAPLLVSSEQLTPKSSCTDKHPVLESAVEYNPKHLLAEGAVMEPKLSSDDKIPEFVGISTLQ